MSSGTTQGGEQKAESPTQAWMRRQLEYLAKNPAVTPEILGMLRAQAERSAPPCEAASEDGGGCAVALTIVRSVKDLRQCICPETDVVAIELATSGRGISIMNLVGIALATPAKSIYIPIGHLDPSAKRLVPDQVSIVNVAGDLNLATLQLVAHDAKKIHRSLGPVAASSINIVWDTQVADQLTGSTGDLRAAAERALDVPQLAEPASFTHQVSALSPIETVARSCASTARLIFDLFQEQRQWME
jgi:hypothetical protein